MISPQYLAALVDGEGNVSIIKSVVKENRLGIHFVPTVQINMTRAKRLIEEVVKQYGGRNYSRKKKKKYRMIYTAVFTCRQVEQLLKDILPYLRIKKRQAKLLLEFNNLCKWGGHVPKRILKKQIELYNKVKKLNCNLNNYKPLEIEEIPDSKQPSYEFDMDKIRDLYWDKNLHGTDIAKEFGCSPTVIYNFMHKNNIPIKNRKQFAKQIVENRKRHTLPSKDELIQLYYKEMLSLREIGYHYDAGETTIGSWFDKYNIPRRTLEEALKVRFSSY